MSESPMNITVASHDGTGTNPPGQGQGQAQAQDPYPMQSYIQQSPLDDHHGFLVFPHAALIDHHFVQATIEVVDHQFPEDSYQGSLHDANVLSPMQSNGNQAGNVENNSSRHDERLLGVGAQFQQGNMPTPAQVNEDFLGLNK